jgi:hypothetical protein
MNLKNPDRKKTIQREINRIQKIDEAKVLPEVFSFLRKHKAKLELEIKEMEGRRV